MCVLRRRNSSKRLPTRRGRRRLRLDHIKLCEPDWAERLDGSGQAGVSPVVPRGRAGTLVRAECLIESLTNHSKEAVRGGHSSHVSVGKHFLMWTAF